MMKPYIRGTVVLLSVWLSGISHAQNITAQQAALKEIREAAADICYTVPTTGRQSDINLSGEVDAQLAGVISRVANLGIKGAGQLKNQEYQGVLREQLATTLKDSSDCRKDVFKLLVDKMLPSAATPAAPERGSINAGKIEQRTNEKCSPAIVGAGNVDVKCQ
jgi:hypothetical protein